MKALVTASPRATSLKLACDDLKTYYLEAVTAQPSAAGRAQLEAWFWNSTVLADVFLALKPICLARRRSHHAGYGVCTHWCHAPRPKDGSTLMREGEV